MAKARTEKEIQNNCGQEMEQIRSQGYTDVKLPVCNVCGDISSGFHFGVITCEACKVRDQIFALINILWDSSLCCYSKMAYLV